jgi:DNA-binding transcriptional regulator YbjK
VNVTDRRKEIYGRRSATAGRSDGGFAAATNLPAEAAGSAVAPAPFVSSSSAITDRRTSIAEAAIAIIGSSGLRALTHRAVDRHLGIAEGSTSSYFRTRRALLAAAMGRMVELSLEASTVGSLKPRSRAEMTRGLAAIVERMSAPAAQSLMVAHFELGFEARRDAELRIVFTELRTVFIDHAVRLVREVGGAEPERAGPALAVFINGLVLERLWHGESVVPADELPAHIDRFLDRHLE